MTKATPQVVIAAGTEANPIVTMITPGRRALGETWSKVSILWDSDERAYVLKREDAEAPADNLPIFVPGLGNLSMEAVDFIVQSQQKEAEYRERAKSKTRAQVAKENNERVNRMWQEFMEQKLRWLKGQTTMGPGGFNQREKL